MGEIAREVGRLPLIARCTVIGSASVGIAVAIGGLVNGLVEYPATAFFALLEGGLLGGVAGGLLGLVAGLVAFLLSTAARRIIHRS